VRPVEARQGLHGQAIRRALEVFPPEKLYIDPDCGLKTRLKEEAIAKLTNMVAAVREVKQELGVPASRP